MKKKYMVLILVVVLSAVGITSASEGTKILREQWERKWMDYGYAPEDLMGVAAIRKYVDEPSVDFIMQRKYECGSWEATAESYGIDLADFNADMEAAQHWEDFKTISETLYKEMQSEGMSEDECVDFVRRTYNAGFDLETTWEAHKNGKTIAELKKEKAALDDEKAQTATDYTFGKITEEEYLKKMQELSPDMSVPEITKFADEDRAEWRRFRIETSGVTEEEIAWAEQAGMTNIFDICRAKDAESFTNMTFEDIVTAAVQPGNDLNGVIQSHVNPDVKE